MLGLMIPSKLLSRGVPLVACALLSYLVASAKDDGTGTLPFTVLEFQMQGSRENVMHLLDVLYEHGLARYVASGESLWFMVPLMLVDPGSAPMLPYSPSPSPPNPPLSPSPLRPEERKKDTSVSKEREKALDIAPDAESVEQLWAQFDEVYPRRVGNLNRAKGKEVFRRLVKTGGAVLGREIVRGARAFRAWADRNARSNTEFIPMMTTWLNQRRWDDEHGDANNTIEGHMARFKFEED